MCTCARDVYDPFVFSDDEVHIAGHAHWAGELSASAPVIQIMCTEPQVPHFLIALGGPWVRVVRTDQDEGPHGGPRFGVTSAATAFHGILSAHLLRDAPRRGNRCVSVCVWGNSMVLGTSYMYMYRSGYG